MGEGVYGRDIEVETHECERVCRKGWVRRRLRKADKLKRKRW